MHFAKRRIRFGDVAAATLARCPEVDQLLAPVPFLGLLKVVIRKSVARRGAFEVDVDLIPQPRAMWIPLAANNLNVTFAGARVRIALETNPVSQVGQGHSLSLAVQRAAVQGYLDLTAHHRSPGVFSRPNLPGGARFQQVAGVRCEWIAARRLDGFEFSAHHLQNHPWFVPGSTLSGGGTVGEVAASQADSPCLVTDTSSNANAGVAVRSFLDHCRVAKRLSQHTLRAYSGDLSDFLAFVGDSTAVGSVGRDDVRGYARILLDDRCLKEATAKRRLATLKVLFRWLELEELVPLSVFHRLDVSIRMPRRLPRALDGDEIRLLVQAAETGAGCARGWRCHRALLMHFVVVALFTTGLRVGELVSVRLDDVSLRDGTILVRGKGNRERRVYLPGREARSVLTSYLRARERTPTALELLLVTESGTALGTQHVRRYLGALARRAGIRRHITPHMLRHTAATQLLEAGVDIRLVQRLLGHASIATTQIYTEVRDEALRARLVRANTLARIRRNG